MDDKNMQGNMNNGKTCQTCGCSCGCGWHGGRHMRFSLLRWVLGIIIILFVFWIGLKVGEFKGEFEGGYGMRSQRGMMMPNMMYSTGANGGASATVPTQTTTTGNTQ